MTLSLDLVLQHPDIGVVSPMVTDGVLRCEIDRYPRWSLTVNIRPDPNGVQLYETPYGTTAIVTRKDGSRMFTGPVYRANVSRPDGQWTLMAADPILLFSQYKFSERPKQCLPGSTMTLPQWISTVAAAIGADVRISGSAAGGGLVDARSIDVAGRDAWDIIEEQLIANTLDVQVHADGGIEVVPTFALKQVPDASLTVGEQGTMTAYTIDMQRRINRVVLTNECIKQGQESKFIDGAWEDNDPLMGIPSVGAVVYTKTVRQGEDWWENPAAKQSQANAAAAAVAQTLRGMAREADIECIPDYSLQVGMTVDVKFMRQVSDRFLVTAVEWPLEPGVMRVRGRNPAPGWGSPLVKTMTRSVRNAR